MAFTMDWVFKVNSHVVYLTNTQNTISTLICNSISVSQPFILGVLQGNIYSGPHLIYHYINDLPLCTRKAGILMFIRLEPNMPA